MLRSKTALSRARRCARNCLATRASVSGRRWRRRTLRSGRICRRRAAARSCAACSRPVNSACPRATFRHSKARSDDRTSRQAAFVARAHAGSVEANDPHPPLRGETVSYTHLRAHETDSYLVCRLLLEKKKKKKKRKKKK